MNLPGIRAMINRLKPEESTLSPESLVDRCLEMLGGYQLEVETISRLVAHDRSEGESGTGSQGFPERVGQMLQLIVSTPEYLFA